MKHGTVRRNAADVLFSRAEQTETSWERMHGLLGRDKIGEDQLMWLDHCRSVHSFAMQFPVDLAYLDGDGVVRKIVSCFWPSRMSICWSAKSTLEMSKGSLGRLGLAVGDRIDFLEKHGNVGLHEMDENR